MTTETINAPEIDSKTETTMKAILHETFGSPATALRLADVATPSAGAGEVLVRVKATGIAIGDWLTTQGIPMIARPMFGWLRPRHAVAGSELAGVVEAVGEGVADFHPGDEVIGLGSGTLAEYAVLPTESLTRKPAGVAMVDAATVPVSGITALQALRDAGGLQPGMRVLVIGASGAVGTFAVQIAKALGGEVTGVASTRNLDMVRSLGADHVIDYTESDFTEMDDQYDLILDMAGNRPLRQLRRALTVDGTLVLVGGSGGRVMMGFGRTIRAGLLSPFVRHTLRSFISSPNRNDLEFLAGMLADGKITPAIDRTYDLADAAAALDHVGGRHTQGKTVITI